MKFGVVNKSIILNRFVLHTLQRNITHLAVITRKTNKKLGILKGGGGGTGKEPKKFRWEKLENSLFSFFLQGWQAESDFSKQAQTTHNRTKFVGIAILKSVICFIQKAV